MEILRSGTKTFELKTQWHELTPPEFVEAVSLLHNLIAGNCDIFDFRLQLLKVLTNYNRPGKLSRFKNWMFRMPVDASNVNSNLFYLANLLRFPLKPVYNAEALEILSPALKQELTYLFPFEVSEKYHDELNMVIDVLEGKFEVNRNFSKNLLPELYIQREVLFGPRFNVDKHGVVDTDLCVDEFSDATAFINLWSKSKDDTHLCSAIAMLYRPIRSIYDTANNMEYVEGIKQLTASEKMAVLEVFAYIREYFYQHPAYSLLFSDNTTIPTISTGWEQMVQILASDGQGSQMEISRWNIVRFFNAQINRLKKDIAEMRGAKMDDSKIANALNLSLDNLLKL